ncbi:MAG: hypothetical protein LPK02_07295 [Rhodobacterales bacterium]|nr:hypothetical protein [Rhodobacterales bacterium]
MKLSDLFAMLISIPAVMAWVVYGIAFLINPHMTAAVDPITVALGSVGIYYGIMVFLAAIYFLGWLGIMLLSATL